MTNVCAPRNETWTLGTHKSSCGQGTAQTPEGGGGRGGGQRPPGPGAALPPAPPRQKLPQGVDGHGAHRPARWGAGGTGATPWWALPGAASEEATPTPGTTTCPDSEAKCGPEIWGHSTLLLKVSKPVTTKPHVFPGLLQQCVDRDALKVSKQKARLL